MPTPQASTPPSLNEAAKSSSHNSSTLPWIRVLASGVGHTVRELVDVAFACVGLEAEAYLRIELQRRDDDTRLAVLTAVGGDWADRIAHLLR